MNRRLRQPALPVPPLAAAGDKAVAHQNSEHGIGAALLLVMVVMLCQPLLRQHRRGDDCCLAEWRGDGEDVTVALNPIGNLPQRRALGIISRPEQPVTRRGDHRGRRPHDSLYLRPTGLESFADTDFHEAPWRACTNVRPWISPLMARRS